MQAADLDQRVTLRTRAAGQDAIGQPVLTWTDVATVWANVRYNSGAESIKAGADTSVVKASIRIRYRAGVLADMRAVHGTEVFEIKAVLPAKRKGYVDLVCEVINAQS